MFSAFIAAARTAVLEAAPVLSVAVAEAVAAQPTALACIHASYLLQHQQPDCHGLHPAVVDSSTHTLAALQNHMPGMGGKPELQVPVTLEAIAGSASHVLEQLDPRALTSTAVLKPIAEKGSMLSGVRLFAAQVAQVYMSEFRLKVGWMQSKNRPCTQYSL
jgi:hypothetical protein